MILEVASMMEKAKSVTYSAWLGASSGAPQITMYASPMVSTWRERDKRERERERDKERKPQIDKNVYINSERSKSTCTL